MIGSNIIDNPSRGNPFAGDSHIEQTYEFFENSSLMLDLREVFSTANRFNTAIYSLDPRGLATGEFDVSQPNISYMTDSRTLQSTQETLYVLAEETDGRAIINQNDFAPGLRQMLRDGKLLLFARVQFHPNGKRWKVSRNYGSGKAQWRAGSEPQGLLGHY